MVGGGLGNVTSAPVNKFIVGMGFQAGEGDHLRTVVIVVVKTEGIMGIFFSLGPCRWGLEAQEAE
jgi:hypothetical protein